LLHKLAINSAQRLEFDFAEQTARTIPILYWRFSALNQIAAELFRRDHEVSNIKGASRSYNEKAKSKASPILSNPPLTNVKSWQFQSKDRTHHSKTMERMQI
jgi:hypothetical protein